MTFEQKVIDAALEMDQGTPLKDMLDDAEIQQAIRVLADVYTVTGVKPLEDEQE